MLVIENGAHMHLAVTYMKMPQKSHGESNSKVDISSYTITMSGTVLEVLKKCCYFLELSRLRY